MIELLGAALVLSIAAHWRTWRKLEDVRKRFSDYAYRMRRECPDDAALLTPAERGND